MPIIYSIHDNSFPIKFPTCQFQIKKEFSHLGATHSLKFYYLVEGDLKLTLPNDHD